MVSTLFLVICIVLLVVSVGWTKVRVQARVCSAFARVENRELVRCGAGRRGYADG
jgi:hypothetical protein